MCACARDFQIKTAVVGLLHKTALWLMALWPYGLMGSVGIYGTYKISISRRTYMFCFSTLNANTNPNPNCQPAWAPTLAANIVAKPAWAPTLAANTVESLPGHRPWPLTRFIARVGAQAGFATVLAARVGAQAGFATVLAARVGAQADS